MIENFIFIKSVNPGYDSEKGGNFGDGIELFIPHASPENLISLAGLKINYTNSSGNESLLIKIPENFYAAGESILLKYAKAPDASDANFTYTKTLATKGGLTLVYNDEEVLDSVFWDGKAGHYKGFDAKNPTILVRNMENLEFENLKVEDYEIKFNAKNLYVEETSNDSEEKGEAVVPQCRGLEFSEILSYYADAKDEQFIEFHNTTAEQMLVDGCSIKYKNKTYPLSGVLKADGYLARYLSDFNVTKNPTNSGILEILDTDGETVDILEYPNGQKKGTSYAFLGYDAEGKEIWRTTYAVTPGEANAYQEYKKCEDGKVINEMTGNCVKVTEVVEKTCGAGQFLNPLTGRCKTITASKTTECREGYERNPETGRCIKIHVNTGADYSLDEEAFDESSVFIAVGAIVLVVLVGAIYIIYEFRKEILKLFRKVFRRSH